MTAICLYQAYQTNRQIAKYYTPAPVASYDRSPRTYVFHDEDFVGPRESRPASTLLEERVRAISDRVTTLKERSEVKRAEEMEAKLAAIMANRLGPYPMDGKLQLHAVGLYEGAPPETNPMDRAKNIDGHRVGMAHVKVTYIGAPLVLALCAYDPVQWNLEVGPGVQLKKIILGGYYKQEVEGVPDGVTIEGQTGRRRDDQYAFWAENQVDWQRTASRLRDLTGLETMTFWTAYRYQGPPFVIGPDNAEWAGKMTVNALNMLHTQAIDESRSKLAKQLASRSFPDIYCTAADRYGHVSSSFAIHSIFGPYADTMQPLRWGTTEFAEDPRGPSFFGWSWQMGLLSIDPKDGNVAEWPVSGLDVESPHEVSLAFDTKRNQLMVWGLNLLAVDILKKEATLLSRGRPPVCAMTYDEEGDRLIGYCAPYEGGSGRNISELRTFNHRGAELSRAKLDFPIPHGIIKLRMIDGKLLITQLGSYDENHYLIPSDTNFIVDPNSGSLLFACQRKPR